MEIINIRREQFGGIMQIFGKLGVNAIKFNKITFRVLELLTFKNSHDDIIKKIYKEFEEQITANEINNLINKLKLKNIDISKIEKYNLIDNDYKLWEDINLIESRLRSPLHVYWQITNACNLRCKHCNASSGVSDKNELSDKEHMAVLDDLIKNKVSFISFTGGEPLVKKDRLYALAKKAREHGIATWLATNAILVTPEVAEELYNVGFITVQVSIDGIKNHDTVRGQGAFEATVRGIENLKNAGIEPTLCMAIMRPGMSELTDVIEFALSKDIKKIKFIRFLPLGRGKENYELGFSPEEEMDNIQKLYTLKEELKDQINLVFNHTYPNVISHESAQDKREWDCLSGRAFSYIDSNGYVSPCAYSSVADLNGGNILEKGILDIWENSELFNDMRKEKENNKCGNCNNWKTCKGGCKVASFVKYGNLMDPDSVCPLDYEKQTM